MWLIENVVQNPLGVWHLSYKHPIQGDWRWRWVNGLLMFGMNLPKL